MRIPFILVRVLAPILYVSAILAGADARAEKRVALVIGNDRYPNLGADRQLHKAVNDAQAVGDTLQRIGFEVIRGNNLGRQAMIDRLADLTARVADGDTALVFYAGHGVAIGGVNYLVPSDVPVVTEGGAPRVRGASIAEPDVIAEIQAKHVRVAVLMLDACRDNPFPRTGERSLGNTRGLTDANPGRGVFTLYSAGIGQTALDRLGPNDTSRNSVFTRVLIEYLGKPGLHLADLAIEVRDRVEQIARQVKDEDGQPHEQTPAYYDQTIGGRIYLAGLPPATGVSGDQRQPSIGVAPAADEVLWSAMKDSNVAALFDEFLRRFPSSAHAAEARERLSRLNGRPPSKQGAPEQLGLKDIGPPEGLVPPSINGRAAGAKQLVAQPPQRIPGVTPQQLGLKDPGPPEQFLPPD